MSAFSSEQVALMKLKCDLRVNTIPLQSEALERPQAETEHDPGN